MVQEFDILSKKKKNRTLTKMNSIDRLITRAMLQVLSRKIEPSFSQYSFGFRSALGVLDAVKFSSAQIEKGYSYVIDIDVNNCFDNIDHGRLKKILSQWIFNEKTLLLIMRYLNCKVVREYEIVPKIRGLIQGSPLSPLFCNLYFDSFDRFAAEKGFCFCRYADDIKLFAKSYEEGLNIYKIVAEYIEKELKFTINQGKSGVFFAIDRIYLGYKLFKKSDGSVEIVRIEMKTKSQYRNWRTSSIKTDDHNYHITGDGILTKADYTILFENTEKKMYLPIECTESLSVHSSVTFSSEFFSFANEKRLSVNIFDKYGNYVGMFVPSRSEKSSKVLLKQVEIYINEAKRLEMAKAILLAALHNMRENIRYYRRIGTQFDEDIAIITDRMTEVKTCPGINELMLIEARVRERYYNCFNRIMSDDNFDFVKRTKRPPLNALNAMISFGNTILYNRLATEIRKTNLDIRIGFLHALLRRSESLNLDIAELFKPVIVDRVIFTLVNRHVLDEDLHFEPWENGGIYLNKVGNGIFLTELEYKLRQKQKIDGKYYSYEGIMRHELTKLVKFLEGSANEYKPYKYFR
ncbi:MAG: type I-B CRISPR-associated endonuclease Cas1b [Fusobacteriaceae bacterium]|nr:type I-B CRISPR-associated endonuclease Cas1b [Fusobacteriaceae bacterium]